MTTFVLNMYKLNKILFTWIRVSYISNNWLFRKFLYNGTKLLEKSVGEIVKLFPEYIRAGCLKLIVTHYFCHSTGFLRCSYLFIEKLRRVELVYCTDIGVAVSLERTEWVCRFRRFQNYLPQLSVRKSRNFSIVTNSINLPRNLCRK